MPKGKSVNAVRYEILRSTRQGKWAILHSGIDEIKLQTLLPSERAKANSNNYTLRVDEVTIQRRTIIER